MSTAQSPVRRLLSFRTGSRTAQQESAKPPGDVVPAVPTSPAQHGDVPDAPADGTVEATQTSPTDVVDATKVQHDLPEKAAKNARRFTWLPLNVRVANGAKVAHDEDKVPAHPAEHEKPAAQRPVHRSRSQQKAYHSAQVLRDLIVGPALVPGGKLKLPSVTEQERAKVQLLQPKAANKIIQELRQLPASHDPPPVIAAPGGEGAHVQLNRPIHAVCLPYTDQEAHEKHFLRLLKATAVVPTEQAVPTDELASFATASWESVKDVLSNVDVVSLITTSDLGIGEPGDGAGILSGSVPTAETVINGFEQITPQLMALGYATGKAILPDHTGIYPPTDRISALTYWWGFEVVLPPPSIAYLENVPSVAHAIMNFLTTVSVVEGGVRELLPFVRYISQYIDGEFSLIKQQNHGKGVVCAATWILPAALVPRPWDFPKPPVKPAAPAHTEPIAHTPAEDAPKLSQPVKPAPAPEAPLDTPPALPSPSTVPVVVVPPTPAQEPAGVADASKPGTVDNPAAIA